MLLNAQIEICFNLIPHKWANYDNNNNNNMYLEFKIQRKNIQVLWTITAHLFLFQCIIIVEL